MRRKRTSFGTALKRLLFLILFGTAAAFLAYQFWGYRQERANFPAGTTIGGVAMDGLTSEEARERLEEKYLQPVVMFHRSDRIELDPAEVGFNVDLDAMMSRAEEERNSRDFWMGYLFHVINWTWEPINVPLQAGYDPERLRLMIETVSDVLDQPGQGPQILAETAVFAQGESGFVTDIDASLPIVERALYSADERSAELVVIDQEAPELNFELLEAVIRSKLNAFDGMGSVFIMDLQTGEEIRINSDVAMSGLSILKIGIFIEAYRHLELPLDEFQEQLFMDTATRSSNYAANLLLHIVAGEDNTYRGADIFTETMWELGLENTFMAVPYDASPPPQRHTTYTTSANSRTDVTTFPDPSRQTTADDIGSLLAMLYYCSKGGGTLLALYPGELTAQECQAIIDLMVLNEEGNLIRFGVPEGVPVSHKHGWVQATHADAGIVLSPGGDYVLVEYLHQNGDWLQSSVSFPILREISRAVYNYFNYDNPYLGDALFEQERFPGEEIPLPEDAQEPGQEASDTETPDTPSESATPEPTPAPPATNQ